MKNRGSRERRVARRYQLQLPVFVGVGTPNNGPVKSGILINLSSTGAFFIVKGGHKTGEWLTVQIRFPYRKNNSLLYSGRVVRVRQMGLMEGIGVRFDPIRPLFL